MARISSDATVRTLMGGARPGSRRRTQACLLLWQSHRKYCPFPGLRWLLRCICVETTLTVQINASLGSVTKVRWIAPIYMILLEDGAFKCQSGLFMLSTWNIGAGRVRYSEADEMSCISDSAQPVGGVGDTWWP